MTPTQLQTYLHTHIPLTAAMQVRAVSATPQAVVLSAPLQPNINVHHTVFGGSASTLAILSAWSLVHLKLSAIPHWAGDLVIRRSTMNYEQPLVGEFTAQALAPSDEDWQHFMLMVERKGRARITVVATVHSDGKTGGRLQGEFVALSAHTPTMQT
jgi:thioesterase domain-containing protein